MRCAGYPASAFMRLALLLAENSKANTVKKNRIGLWQYVYTLRQMREKIIVNIGKEKGKENTCGEGKGKGKIQDTQLNIGLPG